MSKYLIVASIARVVIAVPSLQNLHSDVVILSDNDLQGPEGPGSLFGALYLSRKQSQQSARASCASLGESLWVPGTHHRERKILAKQLKSVNQTQAWIAPHGSQNRIIKNNSDLRSGGGHVELPVFCTQTAPYSNATFADIGPRWQVEVQSNKETVIGFRDRLTFRFRGIRFAPQPERFTYPVMYNGSGRVVPALKYGPQCLQLNGGSEDCLFLNIWTPSLPSSSNTKVSKKLKPVLFWVFGGGFVENSAADPNFDGGNIASRGDVVMVAVNYRVGAFGFLALKDGITNGNYALADQILGLDWVRKHIHAYGGDPAHITLVGQSSGGASVRALMASPRTAGKFVAAIPMSIPDGPSIPGYSTYFTVDEFFKTSVRGILKETNCTDARSQLECLRFVDAKTLFPIGMSATGFVVDGEYLVTNRLQVSKGDKAPYRLMTGYMADDAAPFLNLWPNITVDYQTEWLRNQSLPDLPRSLSPLPKVKNETLAVYSVGARTYTNWGYRCMNQATAYAGLKNDVLKEIFFFEFDRSYQTPDWPKLDVCEPPRSPRHPYGNPNARSDNFSCHSGQLLYVFGNIKRFGLPYRDEKGDREFEREILDRWAAFIRGETPDVENRWKPAIASKMQTMSLQWPVSKMTGFRDLEQCQWMGLPIDILL